MSLWISFGSTAPLLSIALAVSLLSRARKIWAVGPFRLDIAVCSLASDLWLDAVFYLSCTHVAVGDWLLSFQCT